MTREATDRLILRCPSPALLLWLAIALAYPAAGIAETLGGASHPVGPATGVVAGLQDALLDSMKRADELGYRGRVERLRSVVLESHHVPAIARLSVRRHWDDLDAEQQRLLVATFGELSVAHYAANFDGWSGEDFERSGERISGRSTFVHSVFTRPEDDAIRFDYTLREADGRWRILNVTVDGVSDLSTKQAEYSGVLGREGFDSLIGRMRRQIAQLETAD